MKKIAVLMAALLACAPAWSQLLWRVEGNGLEQPSYLMGTHHFAPEGMADSIEGLIPIVDAVDAVYGEIHVDSMASPQAQQLTIQAMIAPPDSTLDKVLSPADYAVVDSIVRKYLGARGIGLDALKGIKPAGLAVQLQALQAQIYFPGFNPQAQIDNVVQEMGRLAGAELCGLESVAEQIHILFETPISEQAEALVELCRHDSEYEVSTRELADAYVAQDLDKMYQLMVDPAYGSKPTEQELDRMIWGRNRNWVARLVEVMPQKSVLVCVGAGHLPGEQGLIGLLRKAGYTVKPLNERNENNEGMKE